VAAAGLPNRVSSLLFSVGKGGKLADLLGKGEASKTNQDCRIHHTHPATHTHVRTNVMNGSGVTREAGEMKTENVGNIFAFCFY